MYWPAAVPQRLLRPQSLRRNNLRLLHPLPRRHRPPQPAPETKFEEVYQQYSGDIILEGAKNYTVRQGDTLAKITINNYGKVNGYYFPLIMLASRNVVADPDLIEPGMQLTIPDLQRNLNNPGAKAKIKEFLNEIANVYNQKQQILVRDDLRALANTL
ncbi:hypothetical protein AGMMS50268_16780 [Spirochaetia bacterium]|nr:hypothetical protein AGMMS50268_16780 [Spirochaetia bacterium]